MTFTIVLEARNSKEISQFAEEVHNSLAGNKDYVDSNVVLNFDVVKDPQEAMLYLDLHNCVDPVTAVSEGLIAMKKFYNRTIE